MEQRSPEWYEARRGKLTASRIHRLMTGGNGAICTLLDALEREIQEGPGGWTEGGDFDNAAMAWGRDNEPKAVALYEMLHGVDVEPVGFIACPHNPFVGSSPDGVVGGHTSIEVKCPYNGKYHEETLLYGMPKKHYWQVQTQMYSQGIEVVDFMSFDPRQAPERRLAVFPQHIDADAQNRIEERSRWLEGHLKAGTRPGTVETNNNEVPSFF